MKTRSRDIGSRFVKARKTTFLPGLILAASLLGTGVTLAQDREIDPDTGLAIDEHWETVRTNCTVCHSAALVTQQRKSREGWVEVIRWMQETQGLWEFDPNTEDAILTYLVAHYGPKEQGARRQTLSPSLMPPNPYESD